MAKLIEVSPDRMELHGAGRGLGAMAVVVGSLMVGFLWLAAGGPGQWSWWSWGLAIIGGFLVVGGATLLVRGSAVWAFDRRERRVFPPARSSTQPFPSSEVAAVVLTSPRGLGPSLLLLSRGEGRTCTLEVGGAIERAGYRILGIQLAGFLGVPFEDQTK